MSDPFPAQIGATLRERLGVYTPDELAVLLDVTTDTLAEWRSKKTGPDFVKLGKKVMYRADDVKEWMDHHVVVMADGWVK